MATGGGGGWRGVDRVNEFLLTQNPNLKKNIYFFGGVGLGGVGWVCVGGGGRQIDRQRGPNQFAPSTTSKLGA